MSKTRLFAIAALASATCFSSPVLAATTSEGMQARIVAKVSTTLLNPLPIFNPSPKLAQSVMMVQLPASSAIAAVASKPTDAIVSTADSANDMASDATSDVQQQATDLRQELIALAMQLRDIRYVRGGHDPTTGFDCSGFVRYVFEHAIGLQLPTNSASQYLIGRAVSRGQMQTGDLVFFRTHGGRHGMGQVSHVGIYLSDGQFIHSPRSGEAVRVDNLDNSYWAKRFAGAKRPEAMAEVDSSTHSG